MLMILFFDIFLIVGKKSRNEVKLHSFKDSAFDCMTRELWWFHLVFATLNITNIGDL